jgi:hypothetical protein
MLSLRAVFLACFVLTPIATFAQSAALPNGLSFPLNGTVFALDGSANGKALQQLHPSEIVSNSHAASNFARSMVYSGPRASVELAGLNAAVHLNSDKGSFFVRLGGDDPELLRGRVALIRLTQTTNRRVVSTFSQNIFGGQRTRKYDIVAVTKTDVPDSNWLKLTPDVALTPGEYGIVFMPKDPAFIPDSVYDFDVAIDAAKPER